MFESVAAQSQPVDASPLWGVVALVVCLIAALVASACLVIRFMTRPTVAPQITRGALEHLQERRRRGEVSARQFHRAWSMLQAAEQRRLVGSQRQEHREAGPRP